MKKWSFASRSRLAPVWFVLLATQSTTNCSHWLFMLILQPGTWTGCAAVFPILVESWNPLVCLYWTFSAPCSQISFSHPEFSDVKMVVCGYICPPLTLTSKRTLHFLSMAMWSIWFLWNIYPSVPIAVALFHLGVHVASHDLYVSSGNHLGHCL